MSIGQAVREYRHSKKMTQRELAEQLAMERTVLSRIEKGERDLSPAYDSTISSFSWKLALHIMDERTGGYISNLVEDVPNMDLHPAALKEILIRDLEEAEQALEALLMSRHLDPEKRKEEAEKVWFEMRDVTHRGMIFEGVIEEEFGLDVKRLIKKYDDQVKRGER